MPLLDQDSHGPHRQPLNSTKQDSLKMISRLVYPSYAGAYTRLMDGKSEAEKRAMLLDACP
ncbi:hypothetical protein D3C71_2083020 [compost metagenome]